MRIKFLLLLLSCTLISLSQQLLDNPVNGFAVPEKCKTMHAHQELLNSDPQYVLKRQAEELQYQQFLQNPDLRRVTYSIPVVVHVIHLGTAVGTGANISNAQIQSAIDNLNDAYSNTSTAHTTYTGVNTNIQFCLAQRDPSGNPTTGIVRVNGSGTGNYSTYGLTDGTEASISNDDNEVAVKALSKWDNTKYYNIWVVTEINNNDGGAGTQGFAYFPGAGASIDGTIILYNSFGYDPDGSLGYNLKSYTNRNVTTVHEVGHALNLYHTFQGDGSGSTCPSDAVCGTSGDCVNDTPPHKRSNSDCLTNTNDATCGNVDRDLYVHNFMDYSSDACQTEFTAGQSTRMQAVLQAGGGRVSLMTSDGCNPVYTDEASMYAIVSPTANECGSSVVPVVTIKNTGSATLTSLTITYSMNGGTNQVYNWTGSLAQAATTNVTLASMATSSGSNTFLATLSLPNGSTDQNSSNDSQSITFNASGSVPASACAISTINSGNYNVGISRVRFNTIDNTHNVGNNQGLQDFSCVYYTTLNANTSYNLTVDLEGTPECGVFIDYNDDGDFNDSGEAIYTGAASASHTPTINIPQYPSTTGKLIRLRIVSDANTWFNSDGCSDSNYGEIEDYGIYINTPPCVAPTLNSSPSNTSACSGGTTTMTVSITGPSLSYEWQVNTGSGFTTISNGGVYSGATLATLTITGFTNAMDGYLYRCYVTNPCGNVTSNNAELLVPAEPAASCSPTTTNAGNFGTGIIRFRFNTIDNSHNDFSNDGTQNFVCSDNTTVTAGSTYAFTVDGAGGNPEFARIYIDYNDNGTFEAGEMVFNQMTTRNTSHTGNITIPSSGFVPDKLLRIRVMTDYSTFSSGCPVSLIYGEVEDYGLYIPCVTPVADNPDDRIANRSYVLPALTVGNYYTGPNGTGTQKTAGDVITNSQTLYVYATSGNCSAENSFTITILTSLNSNSCGKSIQNPHQALYVNSVSGATDYRYEVTDGIDTYYYTRGSNATDLKLSDVSNLITWGGTYNIKASYTTDGVTWTPYGKACEIKILTKLKNWYCGSTSTMTAFKASHTVTGAQRYEYKLVGPSSTLYYTRYNSDPTFRLSWVSGIQNNTSYDVSVRTFNGTSWSDYGASCAVISPVSGMIISEGENNFDQNLSEEDIFVNTFPNPNTGEFTISSSHEGKFNIVNELGQIIQVVNITEENNFEVKVSDLKYGIYFITGTINNEVITKKVVVKN